MEQIGDYLVRRLIGEGGMGKVYEAEERLSKRRVALKVLHQELARSEQGRRLFLNEMQILAHLEHPNIVRSLASTEANGELVMVLEYLDGRTLRALLNAEGRLEWTQAIRIVADIAAALSAAHGQEPPIIHRDLKPENIMVLEGGSVKVMDFGIAKVIEALNQTNTQSVGTLQYMSPEQIDAHTIDHRSDLYCLGLIFYELLAGRPPFQSASPRQLLNLQCTAEPPALPDEVRGGLPRGVESLLFQLLEKAPEDRPYLAEDVIERLEPFQVAAPAKSGGRAPVTPRANATTPAAERRTPKPVTAAASEKAAERSEVAEAGPKATVERADTIALVERAGKPREVPPAVAVGVIVALSALAGIAAYVLRAGAAPEGTPPSGATAAITAPAPFTKDQRR
jgi:serine/threonine-protein kinase